MEKEEIWNKYTKLCKDLYGSKTQILIDNISRIPKTINDYSYEELLYIYKATLLLRKVREG